MDEDKYSATQIKKLEARIIHFESQIEVLNTYIKQQQVCIDKSVVLVKKALEGVNSAHEKAKMAQDGVDHTLDIATGAYSKAQIAQDGVDYTLIIANSAHDKANSADVKANDSLSFINKVKKSIIWKIIRPVESIKILLSRK